MNLPTVFECFPNAVISGVWHIGVYQRGTVMGNQFSDAGTLDVIIDEGDNSTIDSAPDAASLISDMLVYAKPDQLPTLSARKLVASYLLYDSENDDYFEIIDAGIGKNQETGVIEHIELKVRQTEVANV